MLDNIYYEARASGRISPHGGRVTVAIKLDIEGYECRALFGSQGKLLVYYMVSLVHHMFGIIWTNVI